MKGKRYFPRTTPRHRQLVDRTMLARYCAWVIRRVIQGVRAIVGGYRVFQWKRAHRGRTPYPPPQKFVLSFWQNLIPHSYRSRNSCRLPKQGPRNRLKGCSFVRDASFPFSSSSSFFPPGENIVSPHGTMPSIDRITLGFPGATPLVRVGRCQRKEIQGGA